MERGQHGAATDAVHGGDEAEEGDDRAPLEARPAAELYIISLTAAGTGGHADPRDGAGPRVLD